MAEPPESGSIPPNEAIKKALDDADEFTKLIEKCNELKKIFLGIINNNKTENFNKLKLKNLLCEISVEVYEFQSRPSIEKLDTEYLTAKIEAVEVFFNNVSTVIDLTLIGMLVDLTKKLELLTYVVIFLTIITIVSDYFFELLN